MAKLNDKQGEVAEIIGEEGPESTLPEELVEHYGSVGNALTQYRSGKMPKVIITITK